MPDEPAGWAKQAGLELAIERLRLERDALADALEQACDFMVTASKVPNFPWPKVAKDLSDEFRDLARRAKEGA